MNAAEAVTFVLLVAGCAFFLAGTVGILRFPDLFSRLHALTKADNLGLGCIVAGLVLQAETPAGALKLLLIWVLALVASAGACYLIAGHERRRQANPHTTGISRDV
jgi:multicomponent Na+:H+ antiporter subunit G